MGHVGSPELLEVNAVALVVGEFGAEVLEIAYPHIDRRQQRVI